MTITRRLHEGRLPVRAGWSTARWARLAHLRSEGEVLISAAEDLGCSPVTVSRRWSMIRRACRRQGLGDPGPWDALRRQHDPDLDLRAIVEAGS